MGSIRMSALVLGMSLCSSNPPVSIPFIQGAAVLTEVFNVFPHPFQWNDGVLVYRPLGCSLPCSYYSHLPLRNSFRKRRWLGRDNNKSVEHCTPLSRLKTVTLLVRVL